MKKTLLFAGLALAFGLSVRLRRGPADIDARAFVAGIPVLSPDLRLVVARLDLIETAEGQSPKAAWGVDLGTTRASVSAPARAHYAIDLSGEEPVRLRFEGRRLTAVFPDPEVSAVEILAQRQSALVQPGWGRLAAFSGQALVDALQRGLYAKAWAEAGRPRVLAQVRERARPELARLVANYAARLGRGADVSVRFFSEEPPPVLQASR